MIFIRKKYLLSVFSVCLLVTGSAQVLRVDNITVQAGKAETVYSLFANTFQLPVLFRYQPAGAVKTGKVWLGNMALSFTGADKDTAFFSSLSLEPLQHGEALIQTLTGFGISLNPPDMITQPGTEGEELNWKTIGVRDLCSEWLQVVIADVLNPSFFASQCATAKKLFTESGGGALGLRSVQKIILTTTDAAKSLQAWVSIPGVQRMADIGFRLIDGPIILVEKGHYNAVKELVVQVQSLAAAESFLQQKGLLQKEGNKTLILPAAVLGLRIRLEE
jgi:hypothetical protein